MGVPLLGGNLSSQQYKRSNSEEQPASGATDREESQQGKGPRARLLELLGSASPDAMEVAEVYAAMNTRNRILFYDDDGLHDQVRAATRGNAAAEEIISDAVIAARREARENVKDSVLGSDPILQLLDDQMQNMAEDYTGEMEAWLASFSEKASEDSEFEPPPEKDLWTPNEEWAYSARPDESVLRAFGGDAVDQGYLTVKFGWNNMRLHIDDFSPGFVWTSMETWADGLGHARVETPSNDGETQPMYFSFFAPHATGRHFGGDTVVGLEPIEGTNRLKSG